MSFHLSVSMLIPKPDWRIFKVLLRFWLFSYSPGQLNTINAKLNGNPSLDLPVIKQRMSCLQLNVFIWLNQVHMINTRGRSMFASMKSMNLLLYQHWLIPPDFFPVSFPIQSTTILIILIPDQYNFWFKALKATVIYNLDDC